MTRAHSPGITGVVAGALLAAFWLATFRGNDPRTGPPPRRLDVRLRWLFEDNAPGIRGLAVPMNGLLYLYGEKRGAKTVFVASSATRGGILLYTPEMDLERPDPAVEALVARNVGVIREQVAALFQRGASRVLLVPVPTKLSVALSVDPSLRDQVRSMPAGGASGAALPALSFDGRHTREAYERFAAAFPGSMGVDVVALQELFIAQAARVEDPVYAYEDTHWTSLGLNLAAKKTVQAWRGRQQIALVKTGQAAEEPGDLQRMLALPDRPRFRTHPMSEDVYDVQTQPRAEPCPEAAFLLGTSYSSHRGQTLAGQIAKASGCPVTDLSRSGGGAVASLRPLFEEHAAQLRGAVVIWELPFRDLADPALASRAESLASFQTPR